MDDFTLFFWLFLSGGLLELAGLFLLLLWRRPGGLPPALGGTVLVAAAAASDQDYTLLVGQALLGYIIWCNARRKM